MIVCGHRGCAGVEPENTLRGFRWALELGCDFVETDVRLTRDGALVLMHDERVDRTTSGTGRVADLTLDELHRLDAGLGERVPTLEELLPLLRDRATLLCELKGEATADPAVRVVKDAGMEGQVIFTCFDLERIARVKAIDGRLRTGAIFSAPPDAFAGQAVAVGAESVGVRHDHVTAEIIARAHARGLQIRAWNPDEEDDIRAMIALRPDGIGSNRPDRVLRLLGRLPAS